MDCASVSCLLTFNIHIKAKEEREIEVNHELKNIYPWGNDSCISSFSFTIQLFNKYIYPNLLLNCEFKYSPVGQMP